MMFTWGDLLEAKTAADVVNITEKEALEVFEELMGDYNTDEHGLRIRRVNKSFQFVTASENSEYIERLCTPVKREGSVSQLSRCWLSLPTSSLSRAVR